MEQKIITLSSDFGKQTQGVGNMEGVIYAINPSAKVVHLMHGMPAFDIFTAARTMETVYYMPVGLHVCVVDPGVGTSRKGIIVETKRGDFLIGPDNGCLMTAPRILGGIEKIVQIENPKYMLLPVSPIFHGRHIFAPAAAHLSLGVDIAEFGEGIKIKDCAKAPYDEAAVKGNTIKATVIHVNHFGSVHLNILHEEWDKLNAKEVSMQFGSTTVSMPVATTFGDVPEGKPLILKDDYKRIEVAINMGSFVKKHPLKTGDIVKLMAK
ncbi:MAG: SAM-dependent chlorinase/fluorinase [Candidatus Aenigmatarchaeota archaeon]